jgi:basic membrane protein A
MFRKFNVLFSLLLVVSLLIACTPQATPTEVANQEPVDVSSNEEASTPLRVAVVAGGDVGDMGFIDSANEGLKQIESELGLKTVIIANKSDNNVNLDILISAAEQADLIFVVPGYFFDEQLKQVVPQFPDKTFVYVDGATDIAGMTSVIFKQNEGAFLAGALAALLTDRTTDLPNTDSEKVVGFMGGADMPVIHDYQVGFNQGAKYVVPDIEVINQYAGTHFDPAKGKETALAIYGSGADIIFQAAGPTGLGLFEAAKEAEKYSIGVDSDQKWLAPEWTVASMRKNVGDAIFQFTESFLADKIKTGDVMSYGLAQNGVGIDYGNMDPKLVPQDIQDKINQIAQDIIGGKITVDTYVAP